MTLKMAVSYFIPMFHSKMRDWNAMQCTFVESYSPPSLTQFSIDNINDRRTQVASMISYDYNYIPLDEIIAPL